MAREFAGALKLRTSAPELPPRFLDRPRLDSVFAHGARGSITIVCAGAGYGKTMAIAASIRNGCLPGPVAWLAVDESYDVRGFWTDLLDALRMSGVLSDTSPLWEMAPGPQFGLRELNAIVDALTELPDPVVLVLDDFQNIVDVRVLESVSHVVELRIPQVRWVVGTRAEPHLRLSRLRLLEQVVEIGADDLAFTMDEVRELCVRGGHRLAARDLVGLMDRTQGWPAGVRLALLNLTDPHAPADVGLRNFGGNNRRVAEYLLEEVLDRLSPDDRHFLLATSVADQLTADLARQLTARGDSRRVLETLVERNALTVRLTDRPNWFRYHPLMRELLRDRLSAENPDGVPELNRLAAEWFAAENEPITAIRHFSLARDWPAVLTVLGTIALPMILSAQASALTSALAMAEAEAAQHPSVPTLLAAMVCAFSRHNFELMGRHADSAAVLLEEADDPEPAAVILIALARVVHARSYAPGAIVDAAGRLLELADDSAPQRVPAAPSYALIASTNRSIGLLLEGHLGEANAALTTARTWAEHTGMGLLEMAAVSYLSLGDAMVGNLVRAREESVAATHIAEKRGWVNEPQLLAAVASAALVHIQANEIDAAQERVDSGLSSTLFGTDIAGRLIIDIAAVGVATTRGDATEAQIRLKRLIAERDSVGVLSDLLFRWSRVAHADVLLLVGDPSGVLTMIDDPGDSADYAAALERVVRATAFLALDDPGRALAALGPADRFGDYRIQATEAAVIESIAHLRLRRDVEAVSRFADALAIAQPMMLMGPFVRVGAQITAQLNRQEHLTDAYGSFVARLMVATGMGSAQGDGNSGFSTPLTDRELAVLQYLPTVMRASDIADDLFVSVNTVKTHLRGIYSKLGVNNRRDAVRQARNHALL